MRRLLVPDPRPHDRPAPKVFPFVVNADERAVLIGRRTPMRQSGIGAAELLTIAAAAATAACSLPIEPELSITHMKSTRHAEWCRRRPYGPGYRRHRRPRRCFPCLKPVGVAGYRRQAMSVTARWSLR